VTAKGSPMEMWFDRPRSGAPPDQGLAPGETAYTLLGAKWVPAIIQELGRGTLRYGDLDRRLTGISPKVLTQNLQRLERSGLVWRCCLADFRPGYRLTSSGRAFLELIAEVDRQAARLAWSDGAVEEAMRR